MFLFQEMVRSRVQQARQVTGNTVGGHNPSYRFGPFCLDVANKQLRRGDDVLALTPKEFVTLLVLVERHHQLLAKEELMTAVWPDSFVTESNLARNISVLRKLLGPGFIETLPKHGYRFVAPVEAVPIPSAHMEYPETGEEGQAGRGQARAAGLGIWAVMVLCTVGFAGGVGVPHFLHAWTGERGRPVKIAVLPFINFTGDATQEYLADGMTEEMSADLSQVSPRLRVIARTSAMLYKHSHKDAAQIGRELRVDYVLEGSVRRSGDRVRITAELIRVSDQTHFWTAEYDRKMENALDVQQGVAQAAVSQIFARLNRKWQTTGQLRSLRPGDLSGLRAGPALSGK